MIRKASSDDMPAILVMAERFYQTTSYAQWSEFCPITVEAMAQSMIDSHIMLVAEIEGAVVGMVGLIVSPFMFNASVNAAYEVCWWVNPDAQGAGVGAALLGAVDGACKEKECLTVQMACLATSPPKAAEAYIRYGYRHTETSYTKEL